MSKVLRAEAAKKSAAGPCSEQEPAAFLSPQGWWQCQRSDPT